MKLGIVSIKSQVDIKLITFACQGEPELKIRSTKPMSNPTVIATVTMVYWYLTIPTPKVKCTFLMCMVQDHWSKAKSQEHPSILSGIASLL